MAMIQRRKTVTTVVGGVRVGSDAPVVVQSMTNTDTADIPSTVQQCAALARAGSELVRVTVNNEEAAAAVPRIVEELDKQGVRDWLETTGWNKNSPPPELPPDVVTKTRAKYLEAHQKLTGQDLNGGQS